MKQALILTSLLFGACVGSEIPGPPVQPKPDASDMVFEDAPPPPPDMGPAAGCVDRDPAPLPAFIHTNGVTPGSGAGDPRGCAAANCHKYGQEGGGGGAPGFVLAGTIYKRGTTEPDAGATILVFPDASPTTPITLKTDTQGNFYIRALGSRNTAAGVTGPILPASAAATTCPDLTRGHATGKLNFGTAPGDAGNCNACHTLPGDGGTVPPIYVK